MRGLFVVLGWRLSSSIPFWSWLECPYLRWKFPISVGFSAFYGLASISSRTPFGYVCASIHQRSGGMFPCLPACSSSPSLPHTVSGLPSTLRSFSVFKGLTLNLMTFGCQPPFSFSSFRLLYACLFCLRGSEHIYLSFSLISNPKSYLVPPCLKV